MKLLLVIGFLGLPLVMGTIRCYSCDNCGDPYDVTTAEKPMCIDRCLKVVVEMANGTTSTIRSCSVPPTQSITGVSAVHVYLCENNLCNGGLSVTPTSALLTSAMIVGTIVGVTRI